MVTVIDANQRAKGGNATETATPVPKVVQDLTAAAKSVSSSRDYLEHARAEVDRLVSGLGHYGVTFNVYGGRPIAERIAGYKLTPQDIEQINNRHVQLFAVLHTNAHNLDSGDIDEYNKVLDQANEYLDAFAAAFGHKTTEYAGKFNFAGAEGKRFRDHIYDGRANGLNFNSIVEKLKDSESALYNGLVSHLGNDSYLRRVVNMIYNSPARTGYSSEALDARNPRIIVGSKEDEQISESEKREIERRRNMMKISSGNAPYIPASNKPKNPEKPGGGEDTAAESSPQA